MRIEKSVVIARPVEDVWAVLSNLDNFKRWSLSGQEYKQTSPGPLGVGASVEVAEWCFVASISGCRASS